MLEAEIWGIADAEDGNVVFIKPLDSELSVPVFIGQLEAQAILIGFGGVSIPRPLTADLLVSLAGELGCVLQKAEIYAIKKNTFHARLVFSRPPVNEPEKKPGEVVLDARPSDALALAIRCKAPLYIAEAVVAETGIPAGDLAGAAGTEQREQQREYLRTRLEQAVAAENYERAAELRDMIILLDNSLASPG